MTIKQKLPTGFVFGLLVIGFVLFSLIPTVYELFRTGDLKPDRQFELVHNFPTDYNFYLSRIKQGLEGRWTVVEKYTSEPHNGSFIHWIYLLLGQIGGKITHVPLGREGDIYHVARVVLGIALMVMIAEFCKKSFPTLSRYSFLAFLFAATASSWPKLVAVVDNRVIAATIENMANWRFGGYMSWWSLMDSLQRLTFIPHILAGQALMVVLVLLVTDHNVVKKTWNIVLIGLLAFVLGMIFPPGLLLVYVTMGFWIVMSGKDWKLWIIPFGAVVLISVSSLLYLVLMTTMYPWKRLAEVDIIRPLPFDYLEYIQAMGPILPLGVTGLVMALTRREKVMFPSVAWVISWIFLLGMFAFIPQQSPLRFSEMIPHVPLAVLAAYFFYRLSKLGTLSYVSKFFAIALVILGVIHMYSSYLWQKDFVDHKIRATLPLVPTGSYVMYPLKDFIAAMGYLWDATKGEGVILSETTAGNYIPARSGNFVYLGHDNTIAFEAKKDQVKEFFSGRMKINEARTFISQTRARFIFFGPQEREDGGVHDLAETYPFLEEVYRNNYVILYTVSSW